MTFLDGLAKLAEKNAARPALCDRSGTRISYRSLLTAVQRRANEIRRRYGVETFIIIRPEPSIESVTDMLGIMASGNTLVPVNTAIGEPELRLCQEKCGAAALYESLAPAEGIESSGAVQVTFEREPAMVLFTSGTTGTPKGVMVTQDNLTHSCETIAEYLGYRTHLSAAVFLPMHYSYALISQVFAQLFVGGCAHLFAGMRNPIKLARAVNERKIEVFSGVPSTFVALNLIHQVEPLSMPDVKIVCSAGAPFDMSLYDILREIFPNARIFNNYGATEATPRISFVSDDDPAFFSGSCGRPIRGLEAAAFDPDTRAKLPSGVTGIIGVKGANVSPGYVNDLVKTQHAFTSDKFFLTNDFGRVEDGLIFVEGRADDIFDVGGEKVAPAEIEQALMTFPEVGRAAVVGRPESSRGHVPVAFLKLVSNISKTEIQRRLRTLLPPTKIPLYYYRLSEFPETENGKLRRAALKGASSESTANEIP